MAYFTVFLERDDSIKAKAHDVSNPPNVYCQGIAINAGHDRIVIHGMNAEQTEALSVQLHNAAIELGLKVADDPADDVYEPVMVSFHAEANPIP